MNRVAAAGGFLGLALIAAPRVFAETGKPNARGKASYDRIVVGPIVLDRWPEGQAGRLACLEVHLGVRRMARACRKVQAGQVFFHRLRLESRKGLPITLRVVLGLAGGEGPRRSPLPEPQKETPRDSNAVLAQGLPELVGPWGPEGEERWRGARTSRSPGRRSSGGASGGCRAVVQWPEAPGTVRAACQGWSWRLEISPRSPVPSLSGREKEPGGI